MKEYAFDGLVGPTHQYAGLSLGNLASTQHAGTPGNPRAAALQGLTKMRTVADLSGAQGVLPPHERPSPAFLRSVGFTGSDARVLESAYRSAPWLLSVASSASSMWAANAATVAPSADTADARVHFTPANLVAMLHRSLEAAMTRRVLARIFADTAHFVVHEPLPAHPAFGDEGAANHTRLATSAGVLHLFGWGRSTDAERGPVRFPARQTLLASQAVARQNRLVETLPLLAQQNPDGIDAGAFHTDVLAVGTGSVLLVHERAFSDWSSLSGTLERRLGDELRVVLARESELPVSDAVAAYPFNSQLVTLRDGSLAIVAPRESEASETCRRYFERVLAEDNPVQRLVYVDVNDSMKNGGGPACLRLRVPLTAEQGTCLGARVLFDEALHVALAAWVERRYRDRLTVDDLRDPLFLDETRTSLDELTQLLELGSLYDFQQP